MSSARRGVDRNDLEVLTREDCLALVRSVPVGRVGLIVGSIPVVVPVNSRFSTTTSFRTGTGSKLVAAVTRSVVSFEVDSFDVGAHAGWSVLITGAASEITRPDQLAIAEAMQLESWVSGRQRYIRIRSAEVSGRRLRGDAHPAVIPETRWDWG